MKTLIDTYNNPPTPGNSASQEAYGTNEAGGVPPPNPQTPAPPVSLNPEQIEAIAKAVAKEVYRLLPEIMIEEEVNRRRCMDAVAKGPGPLKQFFKNGGRVPR